MRTIHYLDLWACSSEGIFPFLQVGAIADFFRGKNVEIWFYLLETKKNAEIRSPGGPRSPLPMPVSCIALYSFLARTQPKMSTSHYPSGHNSPAGSARELFKSSTDSASLLVSIKKITWFGLGVLLGGRHKVGVFLNFWPTLTGPGRQSNEPFFGSIFLETRRSSASLEPFIDLLACPEPELWPKNPILHKNPKMAEKAWVSPTKCTFRSGPRAVNKLHTPSLPQHGTGAGSCPRHAPRRRIFC